MIGRELTSRLGNVLGQGGDTRYFKENVLKQVEGKGTDTVESGVSAASGGERRLVNWGMGGLGLMALIMVW